MIKHQVLFQEANLVSSGDQSQPDELSFEFSVNELHQFLNNYANEKMHNIFIESVMLNEKFVRGLEGTEIQWNASLVMCIS